MYRKNESLIYYITLYNENYPMPAMPPGSKEGILKGIYRFSSASRKLKHHVQLLGSGPLLNEAMRARELLEAYDVSADIWSVTSYQQLRNDALECEHYNRLNPDKPEHVPYLVQALTGVPGPFITVSDYMKLLADFVARWIPGRFVPLGTEGFGQSDTRTALRRYFEIDAENIVYATLDALRRDGAVDVSVQLKARETLGLSSEKANPMSV
jgi:pyruvate dehydrogenase E1 component